MGDYNSVFGGRRRLTTMLMIMCYTWPFTNSGYANGDPVECGSEAPNQQIYNGALSIHNGTINTDELQNIFDREQYMSVSLSNLCVNVSPYNWELFLPSESIYTRDVTFAKRVDLKFYEKKIREITVINTSNIDNLVINADSASMVRLGNKEKPLKLRSVYIENTDEPSPSERIFGCVPINNGIISVYAKVENASHISICDVERAIVDIEGPSDTYVDRTNYTLIRVNHGTHHDIEVFSESIELVIRDRENCSNEDISLALSEIGETPIYLDDLISGGKIDGKQLILESRFLDLKGFYGRLVIRSSSQYLITKSRDPSAAGPSRILANNLNIQCSTVAEIRDFSKIEDVILEKVGIPGKISLSSPYSGMGKDTEIPKSLKLSNINYGKSKEIEVPFVFVDKMPIKIIASPDSLPDLNRWHPSFYFEKPREIDEEMFSEFANNLKHIEFSPQLSDTDGSIFFPSTYQKWQCALKRIGRIGLPVQFTSRCNPFGEHQ